MRVKGKNQQFVLVNNQDPNQVIELKSILFTDALCEALVELGWALKLREKKE
jgi:hypothetical protein